MMTHWLYILLCNNNTYYTGYTVDLLRRYREHQAGSVKCKYTRSFKPLGLVQVWAFCDKSLALKAEWKIKQLTRLEKEHLIAHPNELLALLADNDAV